MSKQRNINQYTKQEQLLSAITGFLRPKLVKFFMKFNCDSRREAQRQADGLIKHIFEDEK